MEADLEIKAIKGAQTGDEDAWRNLFEWHFESVYKYCLSLSAGRQVQTTAGNVSGLAARHRTKSLYEAPLRRDQTQKA